MNKKEKTIKSKNEKLEELKNSELNCEKMMKLAETLRDENNLLISEIQSEREKHLNEKGRWLKEADTLKHSIDGLKEKLEEKKVEVV